MTPSQGFDHAVGAYGLRHPNTAAVVEGFKNHERPTPARNPGTVRPIATEEDAHRGETIWKHSSGALYAGAPNAYAWRQLKQGRPGVWEQVHRHAHHEVRRQLTEQQREAESNLPARPLPDREGAVRRIDTVEESHRGQVTWVHRSGAMYAGPPNDPAWTAIKRSRPREWTQLHTQQHPEIHQQLTEQKGTSS